MSKSSLEHKIVFTSVAPIYSNPSFSSEMINQALFWDALAIMDVEDNWFQIKQKDGYLGWVHSFYLTDSSVYDNNSKFFNNCKNWYFVKDRFLEISIDSVNKFFISFGSSIPCIVANNKFMIIFPNGEKYLVSKESLISNVEIPTIENVINISYTLLNIPYLWGGRSSFGFDCSALIQMILSILNIPFPRDTKDQIKYNNMKLVKSDYCSGDLIFFSKDGKVNHVGIFINKNEYLHSSGYVKINSLNDHDCNYDNELFNLLDSVYRII